MRGTLRDQFRDKHPFFWVVVIAAVFAACVCVAAWAMVYKYAGLAKEGFQVDGQMRIIRVYPGGPAEGKLEVGDTILTVNGHSTNYTAFIQEFTNLSPGTAYTLEIERNAIKQSVAMKLVLHYSPDRSLITELPAIIVAPGFLLLAVLIGLLRPAEPIIRHFFAAF